MKRRQQISRGERMQQQQIRAEKEQKQIMSGRMQVQAKQQQIDQVRSAMAKRRRLSYAGAGAHIDYKNYVNSGKVEELRRCRVEPSGQGEAEIPQAQEDDDVKQPAICSNKTTNRIANKYFATSPKFMEEIIFQGEQAQMKQSRQPQPIVASPINNKNKQSKMQLIFTQNMTGRSPIKNQQRNQDYNHHLQKVDKNQVPPPSGQMLPPQVEMQRAQGQFRGQRASNVMREIDVAKQYYEPRVYQEKSKKKQSGDGHYKIQSADPHGRVQQKWRVQSDGIKRVRESMSSKSTSKMGLDRIEQMNQHIINSPIIRTEQTIMKDKTHGNFDKKPAQFLKSAQGFNKAQSPHLLSSRKLKALKKTKPCSPSGFSIVGGCYNPMYQDAGGDDGEPSFQNDHSSNEKSAAIIGQDNRKIKVVSSAQPQFQHDLIQFYGDGHNFDGGRQNLVDQIAYKSAALINCGDQDGGDGALGNRQAGRNQEKQVDTQLSNHEEELLQDYSESQQAQPQSQKDPENQNSCDPVKLLGQERWSEIQEQCRAQSIGVDDRREARRLPDDSSRLPDGVAGMKNAVGVTFEKESNNAISCDRYNDNMLNSIIEQEVTRLSKLQKYSTASENNNNQTMKNGHDSIMIPDRHRSLKNECDSTPGDQENWFQKDITKEGPVRKQQFSVIDHLIPHGGNHVNSMMIESENFRNQGYQGMESSDKNNTDVSHYEQSVKNFKRIIKQQNQQYQQMIAQAAAVNKRVQATSIAARSADVSSRAQTTMNLAKMQKNCQCKNEIDTPNKVAQDSRNSAIKGKSAANPGQNESKQETKKRDQGMKSVPPGSTGEQDDDEDTMQYTQTTHHQHSRSQGNQQQQHVHRHLHEHFHYHIDLNIQQVNNILINYGFMNQSSDTRNQSENQTCVLANNSSVGAENSSKKYKKDNSGQNKNNENGGNNGSNNDMKFISLTSNAAIGKYKKSQTNQSSNQDSSPYKQRKSYASLNCVNKQSEEQAQRLAKKFQQRQQYLQRGSISRIQQPLFARNPSQKFQKQQSKISKENTPNAQPAEKPNTTSGIKTASQLGMDAALVYGQQLNRKINSPAVANSKQRMPSQSEGSGQPNPIRQTTRIISSNMTRRQNPTSGQKQKETQYQQKQKHRFSNNNFGNNKNKPINPEMLVFSQAAVTTDVLNSSRQTSTGRGQDPPDRHQLVTRGSNEDLIAEGYFEGQQHPLQQSSSFCKNFTSPSKDLVPANAEGALGIISRSPQINKSHNNTRRMYHQNQIDSADLQQPASNFKIVMNQMAKEDEGSNQSDESGDGGDRKVKIDDQHQILTEQMENAENLSSGKLGSKSPKEKMNEPNSQVRETATMLNLEKYNQMMVRRRTQQQTSTASAASAEGTKNNTTINREKMQNFFANQNILAQGGAVNRQDLDLIKNHIATEDDEIIGIQKVAQNRRYGTTGHTFTRELSQSQSKCAISGKKSSQERPKEQHHVSGMRTTSGCLTSNQSRLKNSRHFQIGYSAFKKRRESAANNADSGAKRNRVYNLIPKIDTSIEQQQRQTAQEFVYTKNEKDKPVNNHRKHIMINEPYSAGLPKNIDSRKGMNAGGLNSRNQKDKSAMMESQRKINKNYLDYKPYDFKMRKMREDESVRISSAHIKNISSAKSDSFLASNNFSNSKPRQVEDSSQLMQLIGGASNKDQMITELPGPKPQISDFTIKEQIGLGNFGKVVKAVNNKMDRVVALKIIRKDSINAMKQVEHLINEREVLRFLSLLQLNHDQIKEQLQFDNKLVNNTNGKQGPTHNKHFCPFTIQMYSSFQDQENLYFELEYVEGCSLLSQVKKMNRQIQTNMQFYAAEVLQTLEFLHKRQIIFRDLKPENIVISMPQRGHIKLVDFGFSKFLRVPNMKTQTNCGTPQYIAPEIIHGAGHSFEVDIWSLGVLMAEIVSCQTPFQGDTPKQTYEKISHCQPTFNRKIGKNLRDLLEKIFHADPSLRISLKEMKKHAVFKDFDWSTPMEEQFELTIAPFIPQDVVFNEFVTRISAIDDGNKLKLSPGFNKKEDSNKRLSFNDEHFEKFLKQDKKDRLGRPDAGNADLSPKRKRQNPLGDFKFARINEYF